MVVLGIDKQKANKKPQKTIKCFFLMHITALNKYYLSHYLNIFFDYPQQIAPHLISLP